MITHYTLSLRYISVITLTSSLVLRCVFEFALLFLSESSKPCRVYSHRTIMVTDELVWKEDMAEAEEGEEDDWEECSNEDDAEDNDDDEGEEAPDLVDITSTKTKIGKDETEVSEVSVAYSMQS